MADPHGSGGHERALSYIKTATLERDVYVRDQGDQRPGARRRLTAGTAIRMWTGGLAIQSKMAKGEGSKDRWCLRREWEPFLA